MAVCRWRCGFCVSAHTADVTPGDDKASRDAGPLRLEENLSSDIVCDSIYGCLYVYTQASKGADVF